MFCHLSPKGFIRLAVGGGTALGIGNPSAVPEPAVLLLLEGSKEAQGKAYLILVPRRFCVLALLRGRRGKIENNYGKVYTLSICT